MENVLPSGSIISAGHYITKLPGITGNFRRQLCSYKTSGCISQGDHSLPGSHFRVLHEQPCWMLLNLQSPHDTVPNQKGHSNQIIRDIRARNHIIHIFLSHKPHFLYLFRENALCTVSARSGQACCDWAQHSPASLAALAWAWNALIALNAQLHSPGWLKGCKIKKKSAKLAEGEKAQRRLKLSSNFKEP